MRFTVLAAFGLLLVAGGCSCDDKKSNGPSGGTTDTLAGVGIENAFPHLSFNSPLDLQSPNDGTNRLFVVEQDGYILVFANDSATTTVDTFLNIHDAVALDANEEGLLGLAFHPDYATNGYFYVNYTAPSPLRTLICRFKVSDADSNKADRASELLLLSYNQPYSNHNGGCLAFGPDGYLYIAAGDGGSGGDPEERAQNRAELLGKLLRIDVDNPSGLDQYGIPADNPFVGNIAGYREEIYAYGFRNPWRFSFDSETGKLWLADVGQDAYEEIDTIMKGGNYGWDIMEAKHCYEPESGCSQTGLILPIWEYGHSEGQSVTGGYVYRGTAVTALIGKYVYADFITGRLWALSTTGTAQNQLILDSPTNPSSFGVDQNKELYFTSFDGNIYRFTSTE